MAIPSKAQQFFLKGDPLAAKQLFERAMKISPFHPVWYANRLAMAQIMLGEYEQAHSNLQELVSKSLEDGVNLPEKSRALLALSFVKIKIGKLEAAKIRLRD